MFGRHHMKKSRSLSSNNNGSQKNHEFDVYAGSKIRLLCCTGNMGNARPDEASLNAWIPEDGNCVDVLEDPNYPVMFDETDVEFEDNNEYGVMNETFLGPHAGNRPNNANERQESKSTEEPEHTQFDIICIGMQESTFGDGGGGDHGRDGTERMMTEHSLRSLREGEMGGKKLGKQLLAEAAASPYSLDNNNGGGNLQYPMNLSMHGASGHSGGDAAHTQSTRSSTTSALQSQPKKKTGLASKVQKKATSAVTSLAADRDYTKDTSATVAEDTQILHDMLARRLSSYKRIVSYQRGEMRLMIFVLNSTCPVKVNLIKAQNTGVAGLANKGGIAAEIIVNGSTRLAFVSAHLEAHEGITKYNMRCSSLTDILHGTREVLRPPTSPDLSLSSHCCFLMGDLNFRTRFTEDNNGVNNDQLRARAREYVELKIWQDLNQADELQRALSDKECLVGFETLYCNFPPTFKVERSRGYIYKQNRTPSYTDRILWRSGHMFSKYVTPLSYEPIDDFATSDHKPVRGAFEIQLHDKVVFSKLHNRTKPKLHRRGSITDLFGMQDHSPDAKENLHLFVSDIQCELRPTCTSNGQPPNPYVCLISTPEECIHAKDSKWHKLRRFFGSPLKTKQNKDGSEERTSFGWPRTEKLRATFKPDWTNKDVRCILQTSRADGKPLDLSGAILHVTVFNHQASPSTEDEWIGTFAFNLHHLYKASQKHLHRGGGPHRHHSTGRNISGHNQSSATLQTELQTEQNLHQLYQQHHNPNNNHSIHNRSQEMSHALDSGPSTREEPDEPTGRPSLRSSILSLRQSTTNFFRRSAVSVSGFSIGSDDQVDDSIVSMQVEGSLTRNGKETGKISFTVESWWMDDVTAKIVANNHNNHSIANGDIDHSTNSFFSSIGRSAAGGKSDAGNSVDLPTSALSSRKPFRTKQ